jgi:hypothetical protein
MTFEQMVIEFKARGFANLGSRTEQYLQDAYLLDICEGEDWGFLESTATGTAPLEIADLRTVEYVLDTSNGDEKLKPLLQARITDDWSVDLTETGTPQLYYLTKGTTVNVFPVAANTLQVNYWRVPKELSGTEEPLMPKRWHSLIIDGAVSRAYESSDDWELGNAAETKFQTRLQQMRDSLLNQQHDAPDDEIVIEDPAALY